MKNILNKKVVALRATTFLFLFPLLVTAQEKCGTMENLKRMVEKDPTLKVKMEEMEKQTQEWILNESKMKGILMNNKKPIYKLQEKDIESLCGYDNTYFTTISAPTSLNQINSPSPNCTYGGEYVRVTGLIAGRIYRISTCNNTSFDTQISIYTQGGGTAVAHNDDACDYQSEIYFNPLTSGTYDVLVDLFNCGSNTACAGLEVELVYTPRPVITIPVVVHVIHFGEAIGVGRNISNAQIQSQIQALNEDYRRLNTDINSVPAAFRGGSDDLLIEFCLATQDEFGNPTTGILRYLGNQPNWSDTEIDNSIKPYTIWDKDQYLNMWTVDFNIQLLGYATFPWQSTATNDGVVIKYDAFGFTGNVQAPYDNGRTAVHEVGHWLNLQHIWGDGPIATCLGTDNVFDTPNQMGSSSGCPAFPLTDDCSPNYPGVMFVNYMDYSDDACMRMFTYGQAARTDATLFGSRSSLLSSQGCSSISTATEETQNHFFDLSVYPNPSNGLFTVNANGNLISSFKVINLLGETIKESMQFENIIDLNSFPAGIYFVNFTVSKNKLVTKKITLIK